MTDLFTMLAQLRRPALLMQTARIGMSDYRRNVSLRRLLGYDHPTGNGAALLALVELEAELNEQRTTKNAAYSAARHVEVMIAMMCEARLMRASQGS